MWYGWPIARVILLFTGIAFLMISLQVTIFHYRQNFRHWAMIGPVAEGPLLGLLSIVLAFYNLPALRSITIVLLFVGVASGLAGTTFHVHGIGQRVGGYVESQNYLIGPPLTLPMMFAAISVLGLIALYWG